MTGECVTGDRPERATTGKPPVAEPRRGQSRAARGRALKLGALVAVLVVPAAAACGIQPTGITDLGPAPAASAGAQPAVAQAGSSQYVLFFYQNGRLIPTYRNGSGAIDEGTVLNAMIEGPTRQEAADGLSSALPPALVVKPRAGGFAAAYFLSQPLNTRAKAQFVCTMQYWDQTVSIGILVDGAEKPTWDACSDTVDYYVPMPGDGSTQPASN